MTSLCQRTPSEATLGFPASASGCASPCAGTRSTRASPLPGAGRHRCVSDPRSTATSAYRRSGGRLRRDRRCRGVPRVVSCVGRAGELPGASPGRFRPGRDSRILRRHSSIRCSTRRAGSANFSLTELRARARERMPAVRARPPTRGSGVSANTRSCNRISAANYLADVPDRQVHGRGLSPPSLGMAGPIAPVG